MAVLALYGHPPDAVRSWSTRDIQLVLTAHQNAGFGTWT